MASTNDERELSVSWAGSALLLTGAVAVLAKVFGVVIAPGARGTAGQSTVEVVDTATATFGYTLAALLVALVCGASFELARARRIGAVARGAVVAISGLVVALASPAVVQRLHTVAALLLAVFTSIIALTSGIVAARVVQTRAVGAVLGVLAICALLRVVAWETAAIAADRSSVALLQIGRVLATAAIVLQGVAALFAAAWLGTRSRWRGRVLANVAIVLAFAITYFAARRIDDHPTIVETILHASLSQAGGVPPPYGVASVAAFLVPASLLLAIVALVQRAQPKAITASLALALLSNGAYDVPLQALLVTAAAQWAMLATADERTLFEALTAPRERTA